MDLLSSPRSQGVWTVVDDGLLSSNQGQRRRRQQQQQKQKQEQQALFCCVSGCTNTFFFDASGRNHCRNCYRSCCQEHTSTNRQRLCFECFSRLGMSATTLAASSYINSRLKAKLIRARFVCLKRATIRLQAVARGHIARKRVASLLSTTAAASSEAEAKAPSRSNGGGGRKPVSLNIEIPPPSLLLSLPPPPPPLYHLSLESSSLQAQTALAAAAAAALTPEEAAKAAKAKREEAQREHEEREQQAKQVLELQQQAQAEAKARREQKKEAARLRRLQSGGLDAAGGIPIPTSSSASTFSSTNNTPLSSAASSYASASYLAAQYGHLQLLSSSPVSASLLAIEMEENRPLDEEEKMEQQRLRDAGEKRNENLLALAALGVPTQHNPTTTSNNTFHIPVPTPAQTQKPTTPTTPTHGHFQLTSCSPVPASLLVDEEVGGKEKQEPHQQSVIQPQAEPSPIVASPDASYAATTTATTTPTPKPLNFSVGVTSSPVTTSMKKITEADLNSAESEREKQLRNKRERANAAVATLLSKATTPRTNSRTNSMSNVSVEGSLDYEMGGDEWATPALGAGAATTAAEVVSGREASHVNSVSSPPMPMSSKSFDALHMTPSGSSSRSSLGISNLSTSSPSEISSSSSSISSSNLGALSMDESILKLANSADEEARARKMSSLRQAKLEKQQQLKALQKAEAKRLRKLEGGARSPRNTSTPSPTGGGGGGGRDSWGLKMTPEERNRQALTQLVEGDRYREIRLILQKNQLHSPLTPKLMQQLMQGEVEEDEVERDERQDKVDRDKTKGRAKEEKKEVEKGVLEEEKEEEEEEVEEEDRVEGVWGEEDGVGGSGGGGRGGSLGGSGGKHLNRSAQKTCLAAMPLMGLLFGAGGNQVAGVSVRSSPEAGAEEEEVDANIDMVDPFVAADNLFSAQEEQDKEEETRRYQTLLKRAQAEGLASPFRTPKAKTSSPMLDYPSPTSQNGRRAARARVSASASRTDRLLAKVDLLRGVEDDESERDNWSQSSYCNKHDA